MTLLLPAHLATADIQKNCPATSSTVRSANLPPAQPAKPSGPRVVAPTARSNGSLSSLPPRSVSGPTGYARRAAAAEAKSRGSAAQPLPRTPAVIAPPPPALAASIEPMIRNVPANGVYPWRKNITATVFWIGESACAKNPVPNDKSSWDVAWQSNYGGLDDPAVTGRMGCSFIPKNFVPKLNPFYIALPYNDVQRGGVHKPEAQLVIPWFRRDFSRPGHTVCKGKWVQISYNGKFCFAQWEDCGPFTTDDWQYVFGNSAPKNGKNNAAGIDISPAVRDFLGIKSGEKVDWRFVEARRIPDGPWAKFGANNHLLMRFNPQQTRELSLQVEQLPPLRGYGPPRYTTSSQPTSTTQG